jgi:hypothetical protein
VTSGLEVEVMAFFLPRISPQQVVKDLLSFLPAGESLSTLFGVVEDVKNSFLCVFFSGVFFLLY